MERKRGETNRGPGQGEKSKVNGGGLGKDLENSILDGLVVYSAGGKGSLSYSLKGKRSRGSQKDAQVPRPSRQAFVKEGKKGPQVRRKGFLSWSQNTQGHGTSEINQVPLKSECNHLLGETT